MAGGAALGCVRAPSTDRVLPPSAESDEFDEGNPAAGGNKDEEEFEEKPAQGADEDEEEEEEYP